MSFGVGVFVLLVHEAEAEPALSLDPQLLHGYPSLSLLAATSLPDRQQSGELRAVSLVHTMSAHAPVHSLHPNTGTNVGLQKKALTWFNV